MYTGSNDSVALDFMYVIATPYMLGSTQTTHMHMFAPCRSSTLWQPGEGLPLNVHVPETPSHLDGAQHRVFKSTLVVEVLQTLQSFLDGQLTHINSTLGQISERLDALEER